MRFAQILLASLVCLVVSSHVAAQYFSLPGGFSYGLNSHRQVFDLSPDGKLGIALKNDPSGVHPANLTTFDPIFGTQLDTKVFGFGPLAVQMVKVGDSLRAAVLTSEGGPRKIWVFDVSSTGQLTQLGATQLTTSAFDGGSKIILSGSGQAGFVTVSNTTAPDIVAFSLNDASILTRIPGNGTSATLALHEEQTKRLLAFRQGHQLRIWNVMNPAQPVDVGSVALTPNGASSGHDDDSVVFSSDGRYVFVGYNFGHFAAIDLGVMQVVGTLPTNYQFSRIALVEDSQKRLLAVHAVATGDKSSILLVDATQPSQLSIINKYDSTFAEPIDYKSAFAFSHDGARLYLAARSGLSALNLPSFEKAWQQPVPGQVTREHQIEVYGPQDEVLGAFEVHNGSQLSAVFGAFPAFPPDISMSGPATVPESPATSASFTISLSAPTNHRFTVNYAAADGIAKKNLDFTDTVGTITFDPGVTTRVVAVPIIDDASDEFDEDFTFNLLKATVGAIKQGQSTCSIIDDDAPPSLSIGNLSAAEGNAGVRGVGFPLTLSTVSGKPISVNFKTAANTATEGVDYQRAEGTLNIVPGQKTATIGVMLIPELINEDDETFFLDLADSVNATPANTRATATILNDDAPLLAVEQNSQRAIALDSLMLFRDPFPIENLGYFGSDKRTRIALFTRHIQLAAGLTLTAEVRDQQQKIFSATVEFVGAVPGVAGLTQIVIRVPDGIQTPGDLTIQIIARGRTSNAVLVGIK